jgi:hypothetical protein
VVFKSWVSRFELDGASRHRGLLGLADVIETLDVIGEPHEPQAEAHEPQAEAHEPQAEAHAPQAEAHAPQAEAHEPQAEAHAPQAEVAHAIRPEQHVCLLW